MTVWALSDPHLTFGVPEKTMEVFGPAWKDYAEKIETHWKRCVLLDDLVLVPGDISWAMKLEEAKIDLDWLGALPGTKVILKGNHDYWWGSAGKIAKVMPPSIHFIQNNTFTWNDISIGGARLWDTPEYSFGPFIEYRETSRSKIKTAEELAAKELEDEKIFLRELERLKLSLSQLDPKARVRIAMTHYPPIGADLQPSRASKILESYNVDICAFGHLHNVRKGTLPFGEARGVRYLLTSCDYLGFTPLKVL